MKKRMIKTDILDSNSIRLLEDCNCLKCMKNLLFVHEKYCSKTKKYYINILRHNMIWTNFYDTSTVSGRRHLINKGKFALSLTV